MNLIERYPAFWLQSPETVAIINALGTEAAELRDSTADFLTQCNVTTATWGLELWERQMGLATDVTKDVSFRRSRVISKLRGTGTVTVELLKSVVESFVNGSVEIIEDPGNYHFDIKFVGVFGIPQNMGDLTAAINEIKPAHLTYGYLYTLRTWQMVLYLTWQEASQYTWRQLREGQL